MPETTKLYNLHDGLTGRDGGPYLDQVEREAAEVRRAKVEGREPDLEHPGTTAGDPLVTARQLVETANPQSNPSQIGFDPFAAAVDQLETSEDFPVTSVAEITNDTVTGVVNEVPANANEDPTNPTGAASWPQQMPNAPVIEDSGSSETPAEEPA